MSGLSTYEKQRLKNIEYNKSVLRSLEIPGLIGSPVPPRRVVAKKPRGIKRKRNNDKNNNNNNENTKSLSNLTIDRKFNGYMTRSKRSRLADIENGNIEDLEDGTLIEKDRIYEKPKPRYSENCFGQIPDIPVGTVWHSRMDCSRSGVHRASVAGIHGNEREGCYSIALSGGYEDDVDYGECFTYTGEGGRDLKGTKANPKNLRTAEQSKNQVLKKGNLALSRNTTNGRPVRVVRGFKLNSPYAPDEGYRYDGLYTVEKYWEAVGLRGFMVYKFAFKRCPDQAPPPWLAESQECSTDVDEIHSNEVPESST
ncbi:E3 ubiquitin-protein ligase UHRF1-like [Dendronephthya gigantea]|uniref:E3 ubiquitin-protein ligase UHRF1-like n=1 Tax=Dendronephthya gigantea TaxID=151771 RepID=UPI0010695060|nr:E3 ubiquitin-protein ligase UHRF1-like [Dendronephthya gigantea]